MGQAEPTQDQRSPKATTGLAGVIERFTAGGADALTQGDLRLLAPILARPRGLLVALLRHGLPAAIDRVRIASPAELESMGAAAVDAVAHGGDTLIERLVPGQTAAAFTECLYGLACLSLCPGGEAVVATWLDAVDRSSD